MEWKDLESCCCVIKLSDARSPKRSVSCSGVLLHSRTGLVLCSAIPFSRFIKDRKCFSSDPESLSADNVSDKLRIRVCVSCQLDEASEAAEQAEKTTRFKEIQAKFLVLVNCTEFRQALCDVFREADQWRFHGNEDEEPVEDAQLLSWFAVLQADVASDKSSYFDLVSWKKSSSLQKGDPVVACGSPFGSLCLDLFIGTLSQGIISNLAGRDNSLILTDARCLPGTEGGGLFAVKGPNRAELVGLIVSPFGWKENEWIGLTLVCSFHSILRSISRCPGVLTDVELATGDVELHMSSTAQRVRAAAYPTVCFVDCGRVWGSGVLITQTLVVTCRHVVYEKSSVFLKFYQMERVLSVQADVLFCTDASSPYDLALLELQASIPGARTPRMSQSFNPGEPVVVLAHGGLGRRCGPSQTSGVLSKTICLNQQPVMLQTTCAVQAGASGGAVVHRHSGELLGIVSSNTQDLAAKVIYPHLNFSIPVSVFQGLVQKFLRTMDVSVFETLNTPAKDVRQVWRLQGSQSKL